jgi:hypothetical protein
MMLERDTNSSQRSSGAPFDAARYARKIQITLGAVVLVWVICVGAFVLRSRPPVVPNVAAPLPTLAAAGKTDIEPARLPTSESGPVSPDFAQKPGLEAAPPVFHAAIPLTEGGPLPPPRDAARTDDATPLPPPRPAELSRPLQNYDRWTAVYVIAMHTVYLPDGTRLEAHSGLGQRLDDPRSVNERDLGATPPHLYELTPREDPFHGVQALRLNPVGDGDMFGRDGLLAHPYMLGPKGDSNGCVSFKNYDAFLQAYQNGQVKRLAVVARVGGQDMARLSQR